MPKAQRRRVLERVEVFIERSEVEALARSSCDGLDGLECVSVQDAWSIGRPDLKPSLAVVFERVKEDETDAP